MNIKTPVSWVGNKTSILHILYALFPIRYERYIEPFGGSGAVLLGKAEPDKFEVYNDYNGNLVNLFRCMRDRPLSFIRELGFLPLNARDDFLVLKKFFQKEEFTDEFLNQELDLTTIVLPEIKAEEIRELYKKAMHDYDLRRAVMFLKLIRYGKEGAEIIVDNTQLTIFGGFAPNSSSAEVLSKALGSRTVMSGSVSRGKNDPSQSLQMMERALMTPDELKSMPKGQFIVMKTGFYPMKVKLKLFFKWGIQFEEEYAVEEKGNRKVAYAEKQEILDGIVKKYHPEWLMEDAPPAEAIPPVGGQAQAMTERNEPSSREKRKGGGTGLRTAPRAARTERKGDESIRESRMLHPTKSTEVKEDGQA